MNSKTSMFSPEQFLQVPPTMACAIGLNEAIVLQHVYWLLANKRNGKEIDGDRWIYNTYGEWREQFFPFWTERVIQSIFQSLEKSNHLISCQPEGAASRRKYYRISRASLANLTIEDYEKNKASTIEGTKNVSSNIRDLSVPLTETTFKGFLTKTKGSKQVCHSRPLPESEDEMYKILEDEGIEINPDKDGHFYDQMERSGWTVKGQRVHDWVSLYQSRLEICNPQY